MASLSQTGAPTLLGTHLFDPSRPGPDPEPIVIRTKPAAPTGYRDYPISYANPDADLESKPEADAAADDDCVNEQEELLREMLRAGGSAGREIAF